MDWRVNFLYWQMYFYFCSLVFKEALNLEFLAFFCFLFLKGYSYVVSPSEGRERGALELLQPIMPRELEVQF